MAKKRLEELHEKFQEDFKPPDKGWVAFYTIMLPQATATRKTDPAEAAEQIVSTLQIHKDAVVNPELIVMKNLQTGEELNVLDVWAKSDARKKA